MSLDGYAVAKPRLELLEVLAGIAAYQDGRWRGDTIRWGRAGAWCIVRQSEIVKWYAALLKRHGRPAELTTISRRTLNYQLAGLQRDRYIARERRHIADRRTGKLKLRPTLYKFTTLGRLWIKRRLGWVTNPVDLLAVQKVAQSGFNYEVKSLTSLSSAVDKAPTAPRKAREKTAALRRRTSSATRSSTPRPKSAVREGPAKHTSTATRPAAPRNGQGRTPRDSAGR